MADESIGGLRVFLTIDPSQMLHLKSFPCGIFSGPQT